MPSLIVELGTHWGESYFAFCQSIFENGLDCRSYAVDHWLGEAHSGLYGDEVFEEVKHYNDLHYGQFSHLLRASFDDALGQFSDNSIDLLHIDGFHTYEAVSHDFRRWLPKVRPGGVILVHDIDVRHTDFGVWRLWEEIKQEFSETFEFHHCWGLGVIRKRGDVLRYPPLLNILFHGSPEIQEWIRRYYFLYGSHLEATLRSTAETAVQIYPFGETGYSEETSLLQQIGIDQSEKLSFFLARGLGSGPVRIDPAACPGLIDVDRIAVIDAVSNTMVWEAEGTALLLSNLTVSGSAAMLKNCRSGLLVSYGDDPQLILPTIEQHDGPVRIEISLRLTSSYDAIYEALQSHAGDLVHAAEQDLHEHIERTDRELTASKATIDELTAELRESRSERMLMAFEMKEAIFERHAAERELKWTEGEGMPLKLSEMESARRELETARLELESADRRLQSAQQDAEVTSRRVAGLEAEIASLEANLHDERLIHIGIMQSVSWRVTEPARQIMRVLRAAIHGRNDHQHDRSDYRGRI